jgi:hypothetical protein
MKTFITALLLFLTIGGKAQDSVAYTSEYQFNEGIFLTEKDFHANRPIRKDQIVSGIPKTQLDFMSEVMAAKFVTYKDSAGTEQKLETSTAWGYCQNRTVYLNFNRSFNRINVMGTICHLVATVTTISPARDPMNGNYAINNSYDELRQFIYDTRNNQVLDFTVKNMEEVLRADQELYDEFMKLSRRKKSESVFVFLRRFNAKHPLYLPA